MPRSPLGDTVIGLLGWQSYATLDGAQPRKLDGDNVPASAYLGVLGLPGVTAWYGLNEIGRPQPDETVVCPRPAALWAAWSASSPRSPAAGPSGSPADRPSPRTSRMNWASPSA